MREAKTVRLAVGSYVGAVHMVQVLQTIIPTMDPEAHEKMKEQLDVTIEMQGILASAALSILSECRNTMTEDEWFECHAELPHLKSLELDLNRYDAFVAMDKAGVPLPDLDSPTFQFGDSLSSIPEE